MKKIYTFFLLAFCTLTLTAQPYTETFDNYVHPSETANSYQNSSFNGVQNIEWSAVHVTGEQTYPIDGAGILLRRNDEPSSITATFPNGLSQLSFQYRKAFTSAAERKLDVVINGDLVASTPSFVTASGEEETVYTFVLTEAQLAPYNQNESLTLSIQVSSTLPAGNRQIVVDNLIWAPVSDAAPTEPVYMVSASELMGFQYVYGEGPSAAQSFEVSATNASADITLNASENYEIALEEEGEYVSEITLESYNGNAQTIFVRLKAGLEIAEPYLGTVSVVEGLVVNLSGSVVDEASSINELNDAMIKIYPNPTSDFVYVSYEGTVDLTIELFNISGQRILSQKEQIVNVSHLQSGVYLLKISHDGQAITKKIVKK